MYYLPACNRDLFKSYNCMFYFCHSESPSNIMKIFLIPSLFILEKILPLSKPNSKCIIRKINPYFFDVEKNG